VNAATANGDKQGLALHVGRPGRVGLLLITMYAWQLVAGWLAAVEMWTGSIVRSGKKKSTVSRRVRACRQKPSLIITVVCSVFSTTFARAS
jgi:hypothetical protein